MKQILPIFFIVFNFCQAVDYLWPTNASNTLTAVFGEIRPRRYHAGIDIRTWGKNGYELYAIDNGYIERIRCGSQGYGKAIYIRLDDGNSIVYAHLEKFNHDLDLILNSLINHNGSYTLDHTFSANEYPVNKGDVIGFTGDTGGISGPHLHFEIRDKNERPINPLLTNYSIQDDSYPTAEALAFIPIDTQTSINGQSKPISFPVKKISKDVFILEDTVSVVGKFGIATKIFDKINNQPFHFGLYGLEMSIDGEFTYAIQYDDVAFSDGPKVYNERDYGLIRQGEGKYYRLFTSNNTQDLSFVDNNSLPFNEFQGGYHTINILAWDFNNNSIEINATIYCSPLEPQVMDVKKIDNSWLISINPIDEIKPEFSLQTKYFDSMTKSIQPQTTENNQYLIENISEPFNILALSGSSYTGIPVKPIYVSLSEKQINEISGNIKINHFEHGINFEFIEDEFTGLSPHIMLNVNGSLTKFNLDRLEQNVLTSPVFTPEELDDLDVISIIYADNLNHQFNRSIKSKVVSPLEKFELTNTNQNVKVFGDENTFYESTLIWIEPINAPKPREGIIISNSVFVGPNYIPFENKITLQFTIPDTKEYSNSAIYYYDTNKDKWYYMDTKRDKQTLTTTALSGEIFAVISESTPPTISNLIPNNGGSYKQDELDQFSFYVDDSFSGIDGENNVEIILDGKSIIVRYNSYQKKVFYPLDIPLTIGKHSYSIKATDKAKNTKTLSGIFYIK